MTTLQNCQLPYQNNFKCIASLQCLIRTQPTLYDITNNCYAEWGNASYSMGMLLCLFSSVFGLLTYITVLPHMIELTE